MVDATISDIITDVYAIITAILQALNTNAAALVGLLILGIIVYLAKDLIRGVFGIFSGIGHIGKKY